MSAFVVRAGYVYGSSGESCARPYATALRILLGHREQVSDVGMAMAERELVVELAAAILARMSPEELAILDEEAVAYFAAPPKAGPRRRRDEPIGFGLDLTLVVPYALAVGTTAVNVLGSILTDEARDAARPAVAKLVRSVFRRGPKVPDEPSHALTAAQATLVRRAAVERAEQLGLPRERAELLGDAVVGGLAVESLP